MLPSHMTGRSPVTRRTASLAAHRTENKHACLHYWHVRLDWFSPKQGTRRVRTRGRRPRALGGSAVLGDMLDHDLLLSEAKRADAVAHLAFELDFTKFEQAVENEVDLMRKMGSILADTGKAFFAASGTPIILGQVASEHDVFEASGPAGARAATANAVLALSERGIRSGLVRMPRSVHGDGDRHGLIAMLVAADRDMGTAAYVGDGQN